MTDSVTQSMISGLEAQGISPDLIARYVEHIVRFTRYVRRTMRPILSCAGAAWALELPWHTSQLRPELEHPQPPASCLHSFLGSLIAPCPSQGRP